MINLKIKTIDNEYTHILNMDNNTASSIMKQMNDTTATFFNTRDNKTGNILLINKRNIISVEITE